MQDSEVHSLIIERLEQVDDDDLRNFLKKVLRYERDILNEPRASYKDEYRTFVNNIFEDDSIERGKNG